MKNVLIITILLGSLIGVGIFGFSAMGDNNMMGDWNWDDGHHGMMHGDHHHEECEDYSEVHCEYEEFEDCEPHSEECEEHDEEYCEHHEENNVNTKTKCDPLFDLDSL